MSDSAATMREAFARYADAAECEVLEVDEPDVQAELSAALEAALQNAAALDEERREHARTRRRMAILERRVSRVAVLETHNARLAEQVVRLQRQLVDRISAGMHRRKA